MARDGNGDFTREVTPPVNGDVADADDFNTEMDSIATALSDSINKAGTKAFAADQPMGSHKLTGLSAGSANGHSIRYEQVSGILTAGVADAKLAAIIGLTWADDRMLDLTGANTIAVVTYATVATNLFTQDITYADTDLRIVANTSDAADNALLRLLGGGGIASTRGGAITVAGNEHANLGRITLTSGDGAGGIVIDGSAGGGITRIVGSATNDSATAGDVGQVISSTIASGSATSLTTGTAKNLTSIPLTAGDWDVCLAAYYGPANTTVFSVLQASISQTSATHDIAPGAIASWYGSVTSNGAFFPSLTLSQYRISLASTTTIYAVVSSTFTTSTNVAYGMITARRRR
mgnify:CR=1 FL=1